MRLLLLLALMFAPAASFAAQAGGFSLGGRAVYVRPDDAEEGTWGPGAQARWHFAESLALEVAADYQRQKFPGTTAHTFGVQAAGLYYPLKTALAPYLTVGAGYYATRINGPDLRRNTGSIAPHVGFGAQWFFKPQWSVDAGYRYLWLNDLSTNDPATGAGREYRRAASMMTFGLNMHFSGGTGVMPSRRPG